MEPVTWIFGGVALAAVSATLTNFINGKSKVTTSDCDRKREADEKLMGQKFKNVELKIDHLHTKFDDIRDYIKNGEGR